MSDDSVKVLLRVMTTVLIVTYGVAWFLASLAYNGNTDIGLSVLISVSMIITVPYFIARFLVMFAAGTVISLALAVLGIVFPPLGFLLLAWGFATIAVKLWTLIRSIPFVIVGMLLYSALQMPAKAGMALMHRPLPLRLAAAILFAAIGVGLLLLILRVCARFVSPSAAIAVMLGFACFVLLSLIMLLLPAVTHGMGLDMDGGGDFHH